MKIHAVIQLIGGYAREDLPRASLVGAYTDPHTARIVSLCAGGAEVQAFELDHVPPGLAATAAALGLKLPAGGEPVGVPGPIG